MHMNAHESLITRIVYDDDFYYFDNFPYLDHIDHGDLVTMKTKLIM